MNPTLQRFGYPQCAIREYVHWVVLIRPAQVTFGCTVIAAKADVTSLADLSAEAAGELPRIIGDFERAVRRVAPARKFNYLALMMVDPNPHFHAIPRYDGTVEFDGLVFADAAYPKPPNLQHAHALSAQQLDAARRTLVAAW